MCFPLSGSRRCGRIPPELVVCKRGPWSEQATGFTVAITALRALARMGLAGRRSGPSRTLLRRVTQPMHFPDPAAGYPPPGGNRAPGRHAAGGGPAPDMARNAVAWRAALIP